MVIAFVLLVIGAYLLGSVPAAYLVVKWSRGMDLRLYGSGNIGASNVVAVASKRWAVPVIVFDLGKGMVVVWIAQLVGLGVVQQVTVGLAAIIGHNWPLFLRFNGGRGVLTLLGVVLILAPWLGMILLVFALLFGVFRQLAVGTFLALVALPLLSWFLGEPLGVKEPLPVSLGFSVMFLMLVARRLTAPRTSFTVSVPRGQLIVNRLLFDRDIRDREAWVNRVPEQRKKG